MENYQFRNTSSGYSNGGSYNGSSYGYGYGNMTVNPSPMQSEFYSQIMMWLTGGFALAAVGIFLIGPLVPPSMIMPLMIVTLVALLASGFSRKFNKLSGVFALVIPTVLGVTLHPTLEYYLSNGMGDLIGLAAVGTAIIFGSMAVLGWTSKKSMNSWASKLFIVLLGLIAISLLNVFVFKLALVSFLISIAVVILFSIYTFIDIQRIRDRSPNDDTPASSYALNIFLDIFNIFVSLLNILGFLNRS